MRESMASVCHFNNKINKRVKMALHCSPEVCWQMLSKLASPMAIHFSTDRIRYAVCVDDYLVTIYVQLFKFWPLVSEEDIWGYSKTRVKRSLKIDKTKILMTDGSLMKFESIAECSPWSILQYLWSALSDNWSWKLIWGLSESGRFTQVLL